MIIIIKYEKFLGHYLAWSRLPPLPSPHWITNFMRAGSYLFKIQSTVLCIYQLLQGDLLNEWINEYSSTKGCLMISITKYLTLLKSSILVVQ